MTHLLNYLLPGYRAPSTTNFLRLKTPTQLHVIAESATCDLSWTWFYDIYIITYIYPQISIDIVWYGLASLANYSRRLSLPHTHIHTHTHTHWHVATFIISSPCSRRALSLLVPKEMLTRWPAFMTRSYMQPTWELSWTQMDPLLLFILLSSLQQLAHHMILLLPHQLSHHFLFLIHIL